MRIGIDMISAGSGFAPTAGGMVSYYDGLLGALLGHPGIEGIVAFVSPWNRGLTIPPDPRVETQVCRALPRNRVGRVAYEQIVLPALIHRTQVDAVLFTCNVKSLLCKRPNAVVLQSLQEFLLPGTKRSMRTAYLRWIVPRSLHSTDVVIAVTEAERDDAVRLFGLRPDEITVVHHGMSNWARRIAHGEDPGVSFGLADGRPYVLVVSRLYGFKNHRRLIEAFAGVVRDDSIRHALVVVGGDADVSSSDLMAIGRRLGLSGRLHCLGARPQDEIPGLFQGADAIAYVSTHETFGHPVLEAFAFGKPLLTSRSGATAEVAGDAARLVDPYDVDSIADGLRDILLDAELRGRLREAGPRRSAQFTWERCADGTVRALTHAQERSAHTIATTASHART